MDRRDFITRAGKYSIGGMLLPSFFANACAKNALFGDFTFQGKVLIIGAGAAGLYSGYLLKQAGIEFKILEASPRYGGRLGKNESFVDFTLDLGAQWLHGRKNLIGDLVKESGTIINYDNSENKYLFNGQLVNELPGNPDVFSGNSLPDITYKEHAHNSGFGEEYDWIVEAIAGDYGADADNLSVYWANKEEEDWSSGNNDYKFAKSYFDLFDENIVPSVKDEIVLNAPVSSIDYQNDLINVTDINGNVYSADRVLVTVPITILKSQSISFTPALPNSKIEAFQKIGMGPGMKIFLKFSSRFFSTNIVGGKICAAYAYENEGKTGNDNVLLAFIMGEQAEYLNSLGSDQAMIDSLLMELDEMFNGQASASYQSALIQNWANEPFIQGAYSFSTVGMGDARAEAATPIDDRIYFAGEAMNLNGHHQTVQGAAETGLLSVKAILRT